MKYLFSSESVSIGHPDKLADQISDRILDACLKEDPSSHVACETVISKCLVTVEYDAKMQPQRIESVVLSTQHSKDISLDELRDELTHFIKKSFLDMIDLQTKLFINPAGQFIEGGPSSDTGLTGRKQI